MGKQYLSPYTRKSFNAKVFTRLLDESNSPDRRLRSNESDTSDWLIPKDSANIFPLIFQPAGEIFFSRITTSCGRIMICFITIAQYVIRDLRIYDISL